MNVLLTGGSGDLGEVLTACLIARNDTATRFDVQPPRSARGTFVKGSILVRSDLDAAMRGADCVVHIAAWHGIHEDKGLKGVDDFWALNVQGTFEVFEAAVRAGIKRVVLISSTSVDKPKTIYGQSKILSEQIADGYALRHNMNVVILRPRAFIPSWNAASKSFVEWARRFMSGAVHVTDVATAAVLAIDRTAHRDYPPRAYTIDGQFDFTADDFANWDADGPGSTFRKYYAEYADLAEKYELPLRKKPYARSKDETRSATEELGYRPKYGLRTLLAELRRYGPSGPLAPQE